MLTVKVNYSAVTRMARELASLSAQSYDTILRLETASIIKICALDSAIASQAAIKRDVEKRATGNFVSPDQSLVSINQRTAKGRVWFVPGDRYASDSGPTRATRGQGPVQPGKSRPIVARGNFFLVYESGHSQGHHLPDFYWQAYLLAIGDEQSYIKARIAELTRRRGSMRLSWLQVGDQLGVPLSSVGPQGNLQEDVARNARGPKGRVFQNGSAYVSYSRSSLRITVTNASPLAVKNQGQAALDRAINQRTNGFAIAMQKGVLSDFKARAARWPGIFVS